LMLALEAFFCFLGPAKKKLRAAVGASLPPSPAVFAVRRRGRLLNQTTGCRTVPGCELLLALVGPLRARVKNHA
jgi:hypothetical protein